MSQNGQNSGPRYRAPDQPDLHGRIGDARRLIVGWAWDYPARHRSSWHSHERAQLLYATAGVMSVVTDQGTWTVPPQQAVWVPAGIEHEVRTQNTLEMRTLYIHPDLTKGLPAVCQVLRVTPLLRELIVRATTFPLTGQPDAMQSRVLAVIPDELKALTPEPLHLPLPQDKRLRPVVEGLMEDPSDERTLGAWSNRCGASERTMARLFLKETGLTFGGWRQRLRLVTAVARLAEGAAVTTVAYDLGYDSPSAFIAMFRRQLGATPGRYLAGGDDV